MVQITCVAWDHPRCTSPVEASVEDFRAGHSGIDIAWERRSLFSFGEGSISEQTDKYDLVIYDHPFLGEIADKNLMLDLKQYLDPEFVDQLRADSLGPSFASYEWDNGLFGLPIDAAAQTAAYRPDLIDGADAELPKTFSDLDRLHKRLASRGLGILTPLKQIDVFCLLLTLSANIGRPVDTQSAEFLPEDVFDECLGAIRKLAEISIDGSSALNPIAALDQMSSRDDIAYSPFMFNYTNYARPGRARNVNCTNIPGLHENTPRGACIGGAGIGVSAKTAHPEIAVEYARFLCAPSYQAGKYVENGGQPASKTAWNSAHANKITNGFFANCLATMEQSYLRPRFNGFMPFARLAGPLLVQHLDDQTGSKQVWQEITGLYEQALNGQLSNGQKTHP